jgi:hypothetical protein
MHDIGRTQLEFGGHGEFGELSEGNEFGEFGEFGEVGEATEFGEFGETGEFAEMGEDESPLSEIQEIQLTSELLEVSSEDELEQFLGNLIGTVGNAIGRFARSDTGQALGGILKSAAKQALPVVGQAVGQWVSPGQGGDWGARAGRAAGDLLGLELEGLSQEDREFETARQFVRFASRASRQALLAPQGTDPRAAARAAAASAARVYAPGLVPRLRGRSGRLWPRSGRWMRQGRSIVLYGG